MSGIALGRLTAERKEWRKDPLRGFVAKPSKKDDGTLDLLNWDCAIPGKKGTCWEGGLYKMKMRFTPDYPANPPTCRFDPPITHINVFPVNGKVCLSLLDPEKHWRPSVSIKQILVGIQKFLDEPNFQDPANFTVYLAWRNNATSYQDLIKEQAKRMSRQE